MNPDVQHMPARLRDMHHEDQVAFLVLHEMLHQMGQDPGVSAARPLWDALRDDPVQHGPIAAAAQSVLPLLPRDRFVQLDRILRAGTDTRSGLRPAWIPTDAARQVVTFVEGASSVRCAGAHALHPALLLAVAQPKPVRFVTPDRNVCDLARLMGAVLGCDLTVVAADPTLRADGPRLAAEIVMPPFGARDSVPEALPRATLDVLGLDRSDARVTGEILALADALAQTEGPVIVSVPNGALFRMVGTEPVVREAIVESGRLRGVLSVPAGMIFPDTSIATSLLVLGPPDRQQEHIAMLDLAHEHFSTAKRGRFAPRAEVSWAHEVTTLLEVSAPPQDGPMISAPLPKVAAQDNVLIIERYRRSDAERQLDAFLDSQDTARLDEIAELIRPVALTKTEDGDILIHEAAPADIGMRGLILQPQKETRIDRAHLRKARNQQLRAGDVVLSVKGTMGVVGLVPEAIQETLFGEMWTAGQSLMILRLKPNRLTSLALYEYLSSDTVRAHLHALAGGASIPMIGIKDLRALRVPIPDKAQLEAIELAYFNRQAQFDKIEKLQAKLAEDRAASWPHKHLRVAARPGS